MIDFRIVKKSRTSRARLGVLSTPHGDIETPALVSVATQAAVKAVTAEQARTAGVRMLIANTFHLHLKPGGDIVNKQGGVHKFMDWRGPMMTDSGGFQVFSLGFGLDHGVGKMLRVPSATTVTTGAKPKGIKIKEDGVEFRSPVDGSKVFIGPKESVRIQENIGADIMFAFDECTPPLADEAYTAASLERTHRWERMSLEARRTKQAMFGIVQGGRFRALREASAHAVGAMGFDGFGIGGEFGDDKRTMTEMLKWVVNVLPETQPRHLLGIGHPDDIVRIIKSGMDTFDCTAPTHYARHGTAFTSTGRIDLQKRKFLTDKKPIDPKCGCETCATVSRGYVCHLFKAKEVGALTLLSIHNLHYFHSLVADARLAIKKCRL